MTTTGISARTPSAVRPIEHVSTGPARAPLSPARLAAPVPSGVKQLDYNPWPKSLAEVPDLNERYTRPDSRARTVTVLGASRSGPDSQRYEALAARLAGAVVSAGGNIVTGNGLKGVMGAAYLAAHAASAERGGGENLCVMKTPLWGNEDLERGRAIGVAGSEERRLQKFLRVSDTVVAFPGGAGTLIELAKLVFELAYPSQGQPLPSTFVLVGKEYWAGLCMQLDTMVAAGQIQPDVRARVHVADDATELLELGMPPALRQG